MIAFFQFCGFAELNGHDSLTLASLERNTEK